jgi:hypothetical protein
MQGNESSFGKDTGGTDQVQPVNCLVEFLQCTFQLANTLPFILHPSAFILHNNLPSQCGNIFRHQGQS